MSVRADDTKAELADFIRDENHQAKRDFPAVRVPSDNPTDWDRHHAKLNELITDYLACVR